MPTPVQARTLQFTRDGSHLVVANHQSITIVELRGDRRRRVEVADIQAIAAFTDQIWVATTVGTLCRIALDGRTIDTTALPGDAEATLIATTIGPPAALWTAGEPVVV